VFSFAFGAAIFHREPFATLFKGQNVYGYGGVEFFRKGGFILFGQGKPTPRGLESVHNLCTLTNVVGRGWPTTRSKRSISRHCFGRLLYSVFSPKVRRSNERGAVQRSVRVYRQDEAAHTLYIEIRAALVPLVHLVQ